jgi:hypothetical protein
MGTPIDCANNLQIINGDFNSSAEWHVVSPWVISGGAANAKWYSEQSNANLYQHCPFVPYQDYRINFDVLKAVCPYESGLRVRLGGVEAPSSPTIQSTGSKSFILHSTLPNRWIVFFLWATDFFPGEVEIDNVRIVYPACKLAADYNFLNLPGTKYELSNQTETGVNVLLAHWNGGSNVLIKTEY